MSYFPFSYSLCRQFFFFRCWCAVNTTQLTHYWFITLQYPASPYKWYTSFGYVNLSLNVSAMGCLHLTHFIISTKYLTISKKNMNPYIFLTHLHKKLLHSKTLEHKNLNFENINGGISLLKNSISTCRDQNHGNHECASLSLC